MNTYSVDKYANLKTVNTANLQLVWLSAILGSSEQHKGFNVTSPLTDALQQEWVTLQNQYDSYEKFSMVIKLVRATLCSLVLFHDKLDFVIVVLCAVFWMLVAI